MRTLKKTLCLVLVLAMMVGLCAISASAIDFADYKDKGRKLVTADVADSEDVIYETVQGSDMAYIVGHYFVKESSSYADTYQKYALRKDSNGHWKILGYQLCDAYGDLLN